MKNNTAAVLWMGLKLTLRGQLKKANQYLQTKGWSLVKRVTIALVTYSLLVAGGLWLIVLRPGENIAEERLYLLEKSQYEASLKALEIRKHKSETSKSSDSLSELFKVKEEELTKLPVALEYGDYKIVKSKVKRLSLSSPAWQGDLDQQKKLAFPMSQEGQVLAIDLVASHQFTMRLPIFFWRGSRL